MAEPAALNRLVQVRILVPQSEEEMAFAISFFLFTVEVASFLISLRSPRLIFS